MIFLTGPRQVGKTTLCLGLYPDGKYLNWDNQDDRMHIVEGPSRVAEEANLHTLLEKKTTIVFDEIHKYSKWKEFLKGFFDTYGDRIKIIVTGSSRLDVYKRGGDSLMGRYFLHRLHPFSVREITAPELNDQEIRNPVPIDKNSFNDLFTYGGFPEPFLKADKRFYNRWTKLRQQQLFQEDVRDFSRIQEVHQLELLAQLLRHQTGQLVNYSTLANKVRISVDTVRRWITVLNSLYFSFSVQPWHHNIPRSLLKQPKIYLWDWSGIQDIGAKTENFIASHLKKAVDWWTDNGYGDYGLYFVRDKEKREVDFLVTRDNQPWFLVEVKSGKSSRISKQLLYFRKQINAQYAFQLSFTRDYVGKDCFSVKEPTIVPVQTFLSQLV
ncbi:ATP-binding protein [bacterium]|nr:ATP-binding protein [bacterium]